MRRLTYYDFQRESEAVEEILKRSDGIAKFCSNIPWQCAAFENLVGLEFGIPASREILIVEEDQNWLVFSERNDGVYFPLESAWMFGCPLIGDPEIVVSLLVRAAEQYITGTCGFVISGILEGSALHRELLTLKKRALKFDEFETTDCMTIDLSEGKEEYLSRRSRSFRKSIRQMKEVESLFIADQSQTAPEEIFERIFSIQRRSHKSKRSAVIFFPTHGMKNFIGISTIDFSEPARCALFLPKSTEKTPPTSWAGFLKKYTVDSK